MKPHEWTQLASREIRFLFQQLEGPTTLIKTGIDAYYLPLCASLSRVISNSAWPETNNPQYILENLVHAYIHQAAKTSHHSNTAYVNLAQRIGLTSDRNSSLITDTLLNQFAEIIQGLPTFEAQIMEGMTPQKTTPAYHKLQCDQCRCIIRTSSKWVRKYDATKFTCPCGEPFSLADPS